VCIEDKLFPKTNSFFQGEQQPLADMEEFCGKIKAGKDSQSNPDFCIVARVEAFIAGWSIDEALKRAYAYADAGADAILIHSKDKEPREILEFMRQWDQRKPVVIVPTTYGNIPTDNFEKAGVSLVVWANHIFRASVTAMQKAAKKIHEEKSIMNIEKEVIAVNEIFRLQNMQELKEAETRYRPAVKTTKAIILAASQGDELGTLTIDKPKCMIEVYGQPILSSLMTIFNENKIKDITAVVGYKKESISIPNLKLVDNNQYKTTGILQSLYETKDLLNGQVIISYGDILFSKEVLRDSMEIDEDIVITVDTAWIQGNKEVRLKDIVVCEQSHSNKYLGSKMSSVKQISAQKNIEGADGEWIGLLKLSTKGSEIVRKELEAYKNENPEEFKKADMVQLLTRIIAQGHKVVAAYCSGRWLDVDCLDDLTYADQARAGVESIKVQ